MCVLATIRHCLVAATFAIMLGEFRLVAGGCWLLAAGCCILRRLSPYVCWRLFAIVLFRRHSPLSCFGDYSPLSCFGDIRHCLVSATFANMHYMLECFGSNESTSAALISACETRKQPSCAFSCQSTSRSFPCSRRSSKICSSPRCRLTSSLSKTRKTILLVSRRTGPRCFASGRRSRRAHCTRSARHKHGAAPAHTASSPAGCACRIPFGIL